MKLPQELLDKRESLKPNLRRRFSRYITAVLSNFTVIRYNEARRTFEKDDRMKKLIINLDNKIDKALDNFKYEHDFLNKRTP